MATPNNKKIVDIDVSYICHESIPCQHNVTVHYDDGTKETKMFSAPEISALYTKLNKEACPHFKNS